MGNDEYIMELFVHNVHETLEVIKERMRASDVTYEMLENTWIKTGENPIAYCKLRFQNKKDGANFRKQIGKCDYVNSFLGVSTYHISATEMSERKRAKAKKRGYSGPTGTVLGHGRRCPGL